MERRDLSPRSVRGSGLLKDSDVKPREIGAIDNRYNRRRVRAVPSPRSWNGANAGGYLSFAVFKPASFRFIYNRKREFSVPRKSITIKSGMIVGLNDGRVVNVIVHKSTCDFHRSLNRSCRCSFNNTARLRDYFVFRTRKRENQVNLFSPRRRFNYRVHDTVLRDRNDIYNFPINFTMIFYNIVMMLLFTYLLYAIQLSFQDVKIVKSSGA